MDKINYYLHLREFGIPEGIAMSMMQQRCSGEEATSKSDAILLFQEWQKTVEGYKYWLSLYETYYQEEKVRKQYEQV